VTRIITLNANGIRAAARKGFFAWLAAAGADFVCIQETKAQEHQLPPEALAMEGYHTAYCDAEKRGYSGVAVYSRRKPDAVTRGLGMPDMDTEGRFIRTDFGDLTIASLYVPSGTSGEARQAVKYSFLERFLPTLVTLRNEGRRVIICGDFNIAHTEIDVFDPRSCSRITGFFPDERAWLDLVFGRVGWADAFRVVNGEKKQFTWWSNFPHAFERNLGWRIDYHIVTPSVAPLVRSASIYRDERFSDHAPLIIDYDF
jgi:exodeoxyribonuclease-3